jgi:hypothetical protein
MIESYSSEVFTEAMSKNMMQQYIEDEIDPSNALFTALIQEAIESDYIDPYLGEDMTNKVLQAIIM